MPMNTAQSFEYACPAGTLPTSAPTVPTNAPTQAPTVPDGCIPGFLGISSDGSPLLDDEMYVNEEYGVYIIQQGDGNLVVYRGTPENRGEVIWASGGILDDAEEFFTELDPNSNLITFVGTPEAEARGEPIWASDTVNPEGSYFLGIDCNSEVVSIYAGDWTNPAGSVAVWNSEPTSPPTIAPTRPPTTAPPTIVPAPTAAPTGTSLVIGSTSGASMALSHLSVLALLFVNAALLL